MKGCKCGFLIVLLNILVISSLFAQNTDLVGDPAKGAELFNTYCISCHRIHDKVVGPPLAGSTQRWIDAGEYQGKTGLQWLYTWFRDRQGVLDAGHPYAVEMANADPLVMTPFPQLTDQDIADILAYVHQEESGSAEGSASTTAPSATTEGQTASTASTASPELIETGRKLFSANCASCHKIHETLIGPALAGVRDRWIEAGDYQGKTGEEWLYIWIRKNQEAIDAGYPYAVEMANFSPSAMNNFPQLTDEDIDAILAYIENEATKQAQAAETTVAGGEAGQPQGQQPASGTGLLGYILIGVLILIALILWRLNVVLNRLVLKKKGEPIPEPVPIYKNKTLITLVVLGAFIYVGYVTVVAAVNLGRQQGYMPEQPIKFSHKLHAGIDKIDCQYCHVGARKGKAAMIPSPNICMNCHTAIKSGPQYGTEEIQKIYDAVGYDPNTMTYDTSKQKPIEWVRIHNLPDHVYFNHAQHVVAGGIECQTCHGPVEEMDVVYQFAPLSMGWCVNCHRDTEVKFTSNAYYDIYKRYHDEIKAGKRTGVKESELGGTDCQKCHY